MTRDEALEALNALRSNVIGTQSASWSNAMYPFVAILNTAGLEQFDPTEEQMRQHMNCYGGAGGYPGHVLREPSPDWVEPVGLRAGLARAARQFLEEPTDKHRLTLEHWLERAER